MNMSDMFVGRLKTEVPNSIELITNTLTSKKIAELNISDNALGPIGVASIEGFLKNGKSLRRLLISNNGLGPVRVCGEG